MLENGPELMLWETYENWFCGREKSKIVNRLPRNVLNLDYFAFFLFLVHQPLSADSLPINWLDYPLLEIRQKTTFASSYNPTSFVFPSTVLSTSHSNSRAVKMIVDSILFLPF